MDSVFNIDFIKQKKLVSVISEFSNYKNIVLAMRSQQNTIILYNEFDYSKKRKKILKSLSKTNAFNYFAVENIDSTWYLYKEDNIYLSIIFALLKRPEILVINDLLTWLSPERKEKIFAYASGNNISIINLTSDVEEIMYTNYLIVLGMNSVELEGNTLDVLKDEKKLCNLGFNLPFYFDLSLQLNYYNVLNDIYSSKETLESAIWK